MGSTFSLKKPFTYNASQAEELIELAERKNLLIRLTIHFFYRCSKKNERTYN
jgi:predicted dehydrogenase